MADEHFEPEPQTIAEQLRILLRETREIRKQTTETNGRVRALEAWRLGQEEQMRISEAYRQGASSALLTRHQAKIAIAITTTLCTLAGSVAGAIVRFAG